MLKYIVFGLILFFCTGPSMGAVSQEYIENKLAEAENMFENIGQRSKAYQHLMVEYRQADSSHDRLACAYILHQYASFLWIDGNPSNGLAVFQCALSYCPEDEITLRILITQGIGQTYCELGQYKLAEKYLNESLDLSVKAKYRYGEMMAYHNLGILYSNDKDIAKSNKVNQQGLSIAREIGDKYMEGSFLINLGQSQSDLDEKLANLARCIQIGDSIGRKGLIPYAWYNIAQAQFTATQYNEALQSAKKALSYSDYVEESDFIVESTYALLADIYAAQKDFSSAYHYNELYRKAKVKSESQVKRRQGFFVNDFREIERRNNDFIKYKYWTEINWWVVGLGGLIFIGLLVVVLIFARFKIYKLYRLSKSQVKDTNSLYERLNQDYELYRSESEQYKTECEKLISDLREQNRLLTVFKESRNILLKKISDMIKDISDTLPIADQPKLKNIKSFITNSIIDSNDKDGIKYGATVDSEVLAVDFRERLKERFPNLSPNEIQLCEYFQMGLNTREISQLSGKPIKTVNMARYRLRKSLNLSPEDDLHQFLQSI